MDDNGKYDKITIDLPCPACNETLTINEVPLDLICPFCGEKVTFKRDSSKRIVGSFSNPHRNIISGLTGETSTKSTDHSPSESIKKPSSTDFILKPIFKYIPVILGAYIILIGLFKLASGSSPAFDRIGFYFLFIPLWILTSIGLLKLLSIAFKVATIIFSVLFIIGLFYIFVADKPLEGIAAMGPLGVVIVFVLNLILTTLLISLIPGVLAGIFVGGLLGGGSDSGLAIIAGIVVLAAVTYFVFNFIWEWIIPFAIGFSVSLFTGKIIIVFVSMIFSGYRVDLPDITRLLSDIRFTKLDRAVRSISNGLENLWHSIGVFWKNYPLIFIGAFIFGIIFAAVLGSKEKTETTPTET